MKKDKIREKRKKYCSIYISDSYDQKTCNGFRPKNTQEILSLCNISYPRSTKTSDTIGGQAFSLSNNENMFNSFSTKSLFNRFLDYGDIEIDINNKSSLSNLENFDRSEKFTFISQLSILENNASFYVLALDNITYKKSVIPINKLKASTLINLEFNNLDINKV